jgi:hypothetical protein
MRVTRFSRISLLHGVTSKLQISKKKTFKVVSENFEVAGTLQPTNGKSGDENV